ncbi:MAG TPA: HEAT repeat domain-containing protein [Sedimentisphaerales bacterium]|nr:HEAT repeat domain-containing protein [Sedimentisphaerales bacterium]
MINAGKNADPKGQTDKERAWSRGVKVCQNARARTALILNALAFCCAAILIFGCGGSSLTASDWPDSVAVEQLVPDATRIVREGLADQEPLIRVNSIEVVATTGQIRFMPEVQKLMTDPFVLVRFASALAVGDLEYALGERSVRRLFQDENENVRIAAAYALGRLGAADSFEILSKSILSRDLTVRANAALAMGKSRDKRALKPLYVALRRDDSDDRVRFQAAQSIAMLGDERIYPKLWTMLISAYWDVRVIGTKAMGALGTAEAKAALTTILDDDIVEVRLSAAEQLGMLGEKTGERVVLEVFAKNLTSGMNKDARDRINALAALAIGRIGTPSLTGFLPRLLKDDSKFVRIAAAKAVLECMNRARPAEKFSI